MKWAEWRVWNLLIPLCPAIKGIPLHLPSIVNCTAFPLYFNAFALYFNAMYFKLHCNDETTPLSKAQCGVVCALQHRRDLFQSIAEDTLARSTRQSGL